MFRNPLFTPIRDFSTPTPSFSIFFLSSNPLFLDTAEGDDRVRMLVI